MRHQVTEKEIASILCDILQAVKRRNLAKGRGGFVSSHEIMGLMLEEWDEAREALHGNDHPQLRQELLDMIVVGVVGIISIDSGKLEF